MRAVFRVMDGPRDLPAIIIEESQSITIGRSEDVTIPVPTDAQMSGSHARVDVEAGQCVVQDLNSTNGTFVNEEAVSRKVLQTDDVLRCGTTSFRVAIDTVAPPPDRSDPAPVDEPAPAAEPAAATAAISAVDSESEPAAESPAQATVQNDVDGPSDANSADLIPERGFTADTAIGIVERFDLSGTIAVQPNDGESPEQFAERLTQVGDDENLNDSLTYLSYALPKRCSVWWVTRCLRGVCSDFTPDDEAVLTAAERWVVDPTEQNRRAAMDAAQKQECGTAACWAGVAAFWTHGSMGPPEAPPVPPADNLTGKAVQGAVTLAAVIHEPEKAVQKQRQFYQLAMDIAAGTSSWKDDKS